MKHLNDSVLFGAAYYHEYQPSPRLEEDMHLMEQAGFTVIRVGESVWSTWEPENGVFDLDWLQPVLDAAHHHGIKVILGTPTYAIPMWLARETPEINVELETGERMGWGMRQEINYLHPAFLFHAERVIRKIIARYAEHPAVIGYQVDNEPGFHKILNDQVFQRFVDHLRHKYGTVEKLNEEWGLTYWSHLLTTWADLWRPDLNHQPQYDLAWRRFQGEVTTGFISWQADVVREYSREDQFVTTCISYDRPTAAEEDLGAALDITAGNPYYRMQDALALPVLEQSEQFWTSTGAWALILSGDRMHGTKQAPFLVTETNAQAIGPSWLNEPAFKGQYRQAAWALVSRGATMIEYWHWHTLHYGTETYWGGILPHSQQPGRVYRELAELGAEFKTAGDRVTELTPHTDVEILWSTESKWAQNGEPSLGTVMTADRRSYHTMVDAFARGTFDAGLQSGIVHPRQLAETSPEDYASEHPVLVAAGFTIADDAQLQWLERYAAAGGHLVVGIRTGYEDEEQRARLERKPAHLTDAAGIWYDEFSNLQTPLPLIPGSGAAGAGFFDLPADARATLWADGVQVENAEVLVRYDHPHFGQWAAATTRVHGSGRVTYVGTVPNPELAAALMDWAVEIGSGAPSWRPNGPTQSVHSATNRHGETVHVIHNWAWEPSSYTLPSSARDILSGEELAEGATLQLSAWDVRVIAVS